LECGGKRSATPLLLRFPNSSNHRKRRRASLAAALHKILAKMTDFRLCYPARRAAVWSMGRRAEDRRALPAWPGSGFQCAKFLGNFLPIRRRGGAALRCGRAAPKGTYRQLKAPKGTKNKDVFSTRTWRPWDCAGLSGALDCACLFWRFGLSAVNCQPVLA